MNRREQRDLKGRFVLIKYQSKRLWKLSIYNVIPVTTTKKKKNIIYSETLYLNQDRILKKCPKQINKENH